MIGLQGKSQIISHDEKLLVTRDGPIRYIDGKPVKGQPTVFEICGNVQPIDGLQLLIVPEGDRHKEQYWVFTYDQPLLNDMITRNGINYQVQLVQEWGSYRKARMMRIDVGPNATP